MDNTVVISTPPHVKSKRTTRRIMIDVVIALIPCAVMGIVYFGWRAAVTEIVSVLSCVASEFVYFFIANKGFSNKCANAAAVCKRWLKQFDFSSVVTGVILAMVLPSEVPWYAVLLGGIFAIALVKMLFGGTGKNLVAPSTAARVFMFLSFSAVMTSYSEPILGAIFPAEDLIQSSATSLSGLLNIKSEIYSQPTALMNVLDLFLGTGVAGCIGETSKAAIILGYIYLVARNVIKWWQPVLYLVVFGFFAVFMSGFGYLAGGSGYKFDMALFLPHIFSGGVAFASVFMFTDYVTSPKGAAAQAVFLVTAAVLTAVLRYFTGMEVVSFIVLLMNLLVPLFDKYLMRKPFGYKKQKKQKEAKQ